PDRRPVADLERVGRAEPDPEVLDLDRARRGPRRSADRQQEHAEPADCPEARSGAATAARRRGVCIAVHGGAASLEWGKSGQSRRANSVSTKRGRRWFGPGPGGRLVRAIRASRHGFSAGSQTQGIARQPGQERPYLLRTAASRSMPRMLAKVASQARTSAI